MIDIDKWKAFLVGGVSVNCYAPQAQRNDGVGDVEPEGHALMAARLEVSIIRLLG